MCLLPRAELHSWSNSNGLFVDYWQHAGTCQQHLKERQPRCQWKDTARFDISFFFSFTRFIFDNSSSLLTRDFLGWPAYLHILCKKTNKQTTEHYRHTEKVKWKCTKKERADRKKRAFPVQTCCSNSNLTLEAQRWPQGRTMMSWWAHGSVWCGSVCMHSFILCTSPFFHLTVSVAVFLVHVLLHERMSRLSFRKHVFHIWQESVISQLWRKKQQRTTVNNTLALVHSVGRVFLSPSVFHLYPRSPSITPASHSAQFLSCLFWVQDLIFTFEVIPVWINTHSSWNWASSPSIQRRLQTLFFIIDSGVLQLLSALREAARTRGWKSLLAQ